MISFGQGQTFSGIAVKPNPYIARIRNLNLEPVLLKNRAFIRTTLMALREDKQCDDRERLQKLHNALSRRCQNLLSLAGFATIHPYSFYSSALASDKIDALLLWSRPAVTTAAQPLPVSLVENDVGDVGDGVQVDQKDGSQPRPAEEGQYLPKPPFSMTLTQGKRGFITQPRKAKRLNAFQVDTVINYYKNKYPGVIILKNGQSELGLALIKKRQDSLQAELDTIIEPYRDEKRKYALMVQWGNGHRIDVPHENYGFSLHWLCIGEAGYRYFIDLFSQLGIESKNGIVKKDEGKDWGKVNEAIKLDDKARQIADKLIDQYINHLKNTFAKKINDCNLTVEEAMQETAFIQKNLGSKKEVVGYVYTNGVSFSNQHFEVVLISKLMIMKPVSWPFVEAERTFWGEHCSGEWSEVMLNSPLVLKRNGQIPSAQTEAWGCGTLGFLYLKELLKDDCRQLKEYTLSFPIYSEQGKSWFFYPSPHVLRYSQFEKYNEVIRKMLEDTEQSQCTADKKYEVSTLKGLLTQSISAAKQVGDDDMVAYCESTRDKLPEFRKKWLAVYDLVIIKRKMMMHEAGQCDREIEKNQYLVAASHRLDEKPKGK